jgi:hypothetical protein
MEKKMKKEDGKSDDGAMKREDMPHMMNGMMDKMFSTMTVEDRIQICYDNDAKMFEYDLCRDWPRSQGTK